jgi:uncharacterized protein YndB with AHSA1/START domain
MGSQAIARRALGYQPAMSTTKRVMRATPEQVWEVLADGWLYPLWVVGATRMREVDDTWPAPGSRLHHSVGTWPLTLDDRTEVEDAVPGVRLKLNAHAWPAGRADVIITMHAQGADTEVVIEEYAVSGPGAIVPRVAQDPLLTWRNVESLRRLAFLVERRQQRAA